MTSIRVRAFPFHRPSSWLTAALLLAAAGCASTANQGASASSPSAASPTKSAAEAEKAADAEAEKQEKIEKKEHELACARIELDIARQSTTADERDAKIQLVEVEFKLQRATGDLDNYKNVESKLATSETDLRLEEAKQRLEEARQELAELEKMYSKEKFAEITKELVLVRGKVRVKLAEKSLELAQKKATQQRDFEIPKKLKELTQALEKAQFDVDAARLKEARVANDKKLKLLKAEHSIDEIERAITKLKSGKDEKETKS